MKPTDTLAWRISSFSAPNSTCVALARGADGSVLVRNSNRPDAGTLALAPAVLAAWLEDLRV